jgi:predicted nucleotidyltransferase
MVTLNAPNATDNLMQFVRLMEVVNSLYRANLQNPIKSMDISRADVQTLFESLNRHNVRYLLVGGLAGVVHGHIRATQDLDLWIQIGDTNKDHLILALQENEVAGAELLKNTPLLFGWTSVVTGKHGLTLDMGHALKAFSELDFDTCYERSLQASFDGVPFRVIHLNDLIREKQATGRLKDLADVEELQKIKDRNTD